MTDRAGPVRHFASDNYAGICPEAWAAMGGRFLAGDGVTTFRNPGKAMECFLKAQSLGYQGPQVFKSLAELDPAHAARWTALAQKP